jgi:hypothetical protein
MPLAVGVNTSLMLFAPFPLFITTPSFDIFQSVSAWQFFPAGLHVYEAENFKGLLHLHAILLPQGYFLLFVGFLIESVPHLPHPHCATAHPLTMIRQIHGGHFIPPHSTDIVRIYIPSSKGVNVPPLPVPNA